MVGTFGYELDVTKLSEDDKNDIREQIIEFNKYNKLVRTGDYYRIGDPFANSRFDSWMFVAKDKSEALVEYIQVLKVPSLFEHRIRLKGLDAKAKYKDEETGKIYGGDTLMNAGILIPKLRRFPKPYYPLD